MHQQKSNIAVFSYAYDPFESGAEIAAREIIYRLSGFYFKILTARLDFHWSIRESNDNSEIIRLGRGRKGSFYGRILEKSLYVFRAWREAEKCHQEERFEAIWAIMASYGGVAALFFKLHHPTIPFLLTIQEGDSESHLKFGKLGLVGLWGRRIIKSADAVQVISSYLKNLIQKWAKGPIEIIPNGVDREFWNTWYSGLELKAIREQLGIKDNYVVITVSRLVYKNGVDILIRAIGKFKERRLNIKLLVIGGGPEQRRLEKIARRLKLDQNVIFLGQIPHQDLPLYFRIADVFARPSRSEGLGSAFLEAMAAGVPVVGTRVGGITDFSVDPEDNLVLANGKYVASEDSDSIALAIGDLIDNPSLRELLVKNAKRLVSEQYDWDKIARLFKNLFDRLINL